MASLFRTTTARLLFTALYALAMVALSFGHRPVSVRPYVDMAAYKLPGGVTPVFCTDSDKAPVHLDKGHGCDACRISAAPGLVPPLFDPIAIPAGSRYIAAVLAEAAIVGSLLPRPVSRGPPARLATA